MPESMLEYYHHPHHSQSIWDFINKIEPILQELKLEDITAYDALEMLTVMKEAYDDMWNSIGWDEAEEHFRELGMPEEI